MTTVTKPATAVALIFKDEDDIDGRPIGPVWFELADGAYTPAVIAQDLDFAGNPSPEWMTKSEASKMARHFHLPLREV